MGVFIVLSWGAGEAAARSGRARRAIVVSSLAALAVLGVLSYRQAGFWKDTTTLFGHALEVTADNQLAHMLVGNELHLKGDEIRAKEHLKEAIRLWPLDPDAWGGLGRFPA